jgi:uncharacterized protein YgbK (DUF1537 family)
MTKEKVVVLDDDPTGTQTVHGIPVLTTWSVGVLGQELLNDLPAFYILTNTRAMLPEAARVLNLELGRNLREASQHTGQPFVVVSRSDSTLRGHFPLELEALGQALETTFDAWLLIPFFEAGGRVTINDIHYVRMGEKLIPVGETEFARDPSFGFRSSNLREWVEEKTKGQVKAGDVQTISLEAIRTGKALEQLLSWPKGSIGIVNLEANSDLETFVQALNKAEGQGKHYLYRTAASFVAAKVGIKPKPLLSKQDLRLSGEQGGLIVVGSYVQKTTEQLAQLLQVPGVTGIELQVAALLDHRNQQELARVSLQIDELLQEGAEVVLYTSRVLMAGTDADSSLAIGNRVSESLVAVIQSLATRPRYLIAKGGITSSDVATKGLAVQRAMVEGQLLPGVPVWRLGLESRFPDLCYVVFPGNVGDEDSLAQVVQSLQAS